MNTDLGTTIAPKSDQTNADDLITGPRTITVTKVSLLTAADQPIAINYEGDNGKPYKPCKSMRRVMVSIWGPDGATYAGRSMTLYRDPDVKFGGMAVGGIRISHMSHIEKPVTMALTVTRANRKPFTVQPLQSGGNAPDKPETPPSEPKMTPQRLLDTIAIAPDIDTLEKFVADNDKGIKWVADNKPDAGIIEAIDARRGELSPSDTEI